MSGEERIVIHQGLIIRPGDSLIVRLDSSVSRDTCDEFTELMRAEIHKVLPGIDQVFVLGGGVEEIAVYRPTMTVEMSCGGSDLTDQFKDVIRRAVKTDGADPAGAL